MSFGDIDSSSNISAETGSDNLTTVVAEVDPIIPEVSDSENLGPQVQVEESEGSQQAQLNVDSQEIMHITETTKRLQGAAIRLARNPGCLSEMLNTSVKDYVTQTLHTFMQTPVHLTSFEWNTSHPSLTSFKRPTASGIPAFGTSGTPYLAQHELPQEMFGEAGLLNKIRHMAMIRADIVVRLMANKQPFQQGAMYVFGMPHPDAAQRRNEAMLGSTLTSVTSIPGLTWNIEKHQSVEFRLKPCGPHLFYDIHNNDYIPWGFHVACLSQLIDPAGTGKVDVSLIAHLDNVQLRFRTSTEPGYSTFASKLPQPPVNPPRSSELRRVQMHSGLEPVKQNSLVAGTKSLAQAAKALEFIPGAAEFAEPVSDALNTVSGLAGLFGFGKPTETPPVTRIQPQYGNNLLSTNGEFVGHSLASVQRNSLDPLPGSALSGEDEMAIRSIANRSAILDSFLLKDTDVAGTQIYSLPVGPSQMWWGEAEAVQNIYSAPPFFHAMQPFSFWNSGWRYHFEAIKTIYQSSKLLIQYVPRDYDPDGGSGSNNRTLRWIWDVKEKSSFEIEVPFVAGQQWLQNPSVKMMKGGDYDETEIYAGIIYVTVFNTLTCPDSVSADIEILVTQLPAPDMIVGGGLNPATSIPHLAAPTFMRKVEMHVGAPSTISNVVNKIDVKHPSSTAHGTTTGEMVLSVRNLIKRFYEVGQYKLFKSTTASDPILLRLQPNDMVYATTPFPSSPANRPDYLNYFKSMFMYRRGGTRLLMKFQDELFNQVGASAFQTYLVNRDWINVVTHNNTTKAETNGSDGVTLVLSRTAAEALTLEATGTLPVFTGLEGFASVEVPYYSKFHLLINEFSTAGDAKNGKYTSVKNATNPCNKVFVCPYDKIDTSTVIVYASVYRAVRDDFELSLFMGCPLMTYTNVSVYH